MIGIGELINFNFSQKLLLYDTKEIDLPPELRGVDYYWRKQKVKSYHYIIEFDETVILSRIVFEKPKDIKFLYYISLEKNGDCVLMEDESYCRNGALKMIDFHFFPCKYVHFFTLNNEPFPDKKYVKCYGFYKDEFRDKYGEDMLQMIFHRTSNIIYDEKIKNNI